MAASREIVAAAIAPLFWISAPLGIWPVGFDGRRFSTGPILKVYCYSFSLMLAGVELWYLYKTNAAKLRRAISGEGMLVLISYLVGNTICILNIFYVVHGRKRLVRLLNRLDRVATALHKSVEVDRLVRQVHVFIFCLQVVTMAIYFYLKLTEFRFSSGITLDKVLHWCFVAFRICGKTTIMCTGAHFCILCILLAALLRATNLQLKVWVEGCHQDVSHHLDALTKLRIHHAELFFASEEVANLYGIFVLLNLVYVNIFFQTGAFKIISSAYKTLFLEHVKWTHEMSYHLYWIFVDALKAGVFFYAANALTSENQQTRENLTKYINAMPAGKLREAVYCMCGEAAQMKIKVSACDLFLLDKQMLFSSIASCTVNLAILMQSYLAEL